MNSDPQHPTPTQPQWIITGQKHALYNLWQTNTHTTPSLHTKPLYLSLYLTLWSLFNVLSCFCLFSIKIFNSKPHENMIIFIVLLLLLYSPCWPGLVTLFTLHMSTFDDMLVAQAKQKAQGDMRCDSWNWNLIGTTKWVFYSPFQSRRKDSNVSRSILHWINFQINFNQLFLHID